MPVQGATRRTLGAGPLLGGVRAAGGQVSWLRLIAPRPSHPGRDSGPSVRSPIQWRDRPGFSPGSLFSLPRLRPPARRAARAGGGLRAPACAYGLVPLIIGRLGCRWQPTAATGGLGYRPVVTRKLAVSHGHYGDAFPEAGRGQRHIPRLGHPGGQGPIPTPLSVPPLSPARRIPSRTPKGPARPPCPAPRGATQSCSPERLAWPLSAPPCRTARAAPSPRLLAPSREL